MHIIENSDSYKEKFYELAVFSFPDHSFHAPFLLSHPGSEEPGFCADGHFHHSARLGPGQSAVVFSLAQQGVREQLGWNFKNGWKDVVLGSVLFVPTFLTAGLLDNYLQAAGFSTPKNPMQTFLEARGGAELVLAFFLVVIVAIA